MTEMLCLMVHILKIQYVGLDYIYIYKKKQIVCTDSDAVGVVHCTFDLVLCCVIPKMCFLIIL